VTATPYALLFLLALERFVGTTKREGRKHPYYFGVRLVFIKIKQNYLSIKANQHERTNTSRKRERKKHLAGKNPHQRMKLDETQYLTHWHCHDATRSLVCRPHDIAPPSALTVRRPTGFSRSSTSIGSRRRSLANRRTSRTRPTTRSRPTSRTGPNTGSRVYRRPQAPKSELADLEGQPDAHAAQGSNQADARGGLPRSSIL